MDLNEYKVMHFFIFSGILRVLRYFKGFWENFRYWGLGVWGSALLHETVVFVFLRILRDFSAFKGIKGSLSDFKGFLGIVRSFKDFNGFKGFYGSFKDFKDFKWYQGTSKILRDFKDFKGFEDILMDLKGFWGILWDFNGL